MRAQPRQSERLSQREREVMCGQHRAWDEEGVEEVVSRLERTGLALAAALSHSQPLLRCCCLGWI